MGGSSGSSSTANAPAAARTDYEKAPTMLNMQAGLPNQINAVAGQLQQGFSGSGGMLNGLNDLYSPMSLLQMYEPLTTTQDRFDKKKHTELSTGDAELDKLLMGGGQDQDQKTPNTASLRSSGSTIGYR